MASIKKRPNGSYHYQHLGLDKQLEIDDSIRNMHKVKNTKKKETRLTSD